MRQPSNTAACLAICFALANAPAVGQAKNPATKDASKNVAPARILQDRELYRLFKDWRTFVTPVVRKGLPDYSQPAMAKAATDLTSYKSRLSGLDRTGWTIAQQNDYRLIEAEMNAFDFNLRILKPWARDPSFYQTVFADQSDVPAHEGPSAAPSIDLFSYSFPLSRQDDATLTMLIGAIPRQLASARVNLADSQAHDLWAYGDRALKDQSQTLTALQAGTLKMRSLDGYNPATMTGASPKLMRAITAARVATDEFARWIAAEAPSRTGPSGVGKDNYNWYLKHVQLNPYTWDDQKLLLQRELDRSLASLRLEELRNRNVPPVIEISDPAGYKQMADAKTAKFNDFLVATGIVPDRPYFRAALVAQTSGYVPPAERNFFSHGAALDPLPLLSHSTHWIELARLKHEPHPDPIRDTPPLFNIFSDRSEGFATAMEELVMQAGLYDDIPHGRELVWIMLANRAARGLASLHVQANDMTLDEAGRFHADWTPRSWSDPASPLVGFEQLLYLRQPGYGPSYIIGKIQLDGLIARASHAADTNKRAFNMGELYARITSIGILPPALIEAELFPNTAK
ncbi:DUF885 domain-containing protein [Sphingobium sp. SCG-1]|uniref:DUF885 domain-containing protein n=1 Tax=Sphingobium sp. SCG-1 TaxID=2072936 RepID=UPI000CD69B18|nr:DUF885 domain-containing protein [Sphingobium sp. SCG-1]AUW58747.1 DUF885 domain-containing protein [Sphingobium sp. SCG-1]